jgi:hypothetical protein
MKTLLWRKYLLFKQSLKLLYAKLKNNLSNQNETTPIPPSPF